jgi:hypothetical protein
VSAMMVRQKASSWVWCVKYGLAACDDAAKASRKGVEVQFGAGSLDTSTKILMRWML